jgi:hypothetical protein
MAKGGNVAASGASTGSSGAGGQPSGSAGASGVAGASAGEGAAAGEPASAAAGDDAGGAGAAGDACPHTSDGPLAFPCAQGFGARALGGRGGDVYHVTTLADAGAGSLREGLETASEPRTIVFEVAGTIALESSLVIDGSNITIAGQTAPGDGITLRDHSLELEGARDIIVRYIRLRRGDVTVRDGSRPTGSSDLDSVSINDSENVIFDHVSVSWSCDELFGIVRNRNVTVQWSLLAEPLGDPELHPYGDDHAFGLNNSANTLSFHHSLVANYVMRGPQFEANDALNAQGYDVQMEAVNNVLFDYQSSGSRYTTGIETDQDAASEVAFSFHFINNLYLLSPDRSPSKVPEIHAVTKHGVIDQVKVHVAGNIGPNRPTDDLDPWLLVYTDDDDVPVGQADADVLAQLSDVPLFASSVPITKHSAQEAYELVLAHAGMSTKRDAVDLRVVSDVSSRKFGSYLSSQSEVGGWPVLDAGIAAPDTDRDGMPDAWETEQGLDPNDASDRNDDRNADGYTNLEDYLESRVPRIH